jgi:hypothetical protein
MYRPLAVVCVLFVAASALAQGQESVEALIKKLDSANAKTREAATKALLDRPDAEAALREAVRSESLEVSRRAAAVLEQLEERRSSRDFDEAIERGRIERAIELIAAWPEGTREDALWERIKILTFALIDRNNQKYKEGNGNGSFIKRTHGLPLPAVIVKATTFSERTKINGRGKDTRHLVWAAEVDFDPDRVTDGKKVRLWQQEQFMSRQCAFVSGGTLRVSRALLHDALVLAGKDIEAKDLHTSGSVIVSCGDITLDSPDLVGCLIIARGSIDLRKVKYLFGCRIIAGKSVTYDKDKATRSVIVENEPNPLGYIRWSDAPKDKAAPKAK